MPARAPSRVHWMRWVGSLLVIGWLGSAGRAQAPVEFPAQVHPAAHLQPRFEGNFGPRVEEFAAAAARESAAGSEGLQLQRPASAAASTSSNRSRSPAASSSSWTTVIALSFVVTLIVLAAQVWKRCAARLPTTLSSDVIEVLGRRPIDPRQSILLVRCGARILILGSSAGGFQTLAEVTDPTEIDYLAALCKKPGSSGVVSQTFRQLLSHGPARAAAPSRGTSDALAARLGLRAALSPRAAEDADG